MPSYEADLAEYARKTMDGTEHYTADGRRIFVGYRYWNNDLKVVTITEIGTRGQRYSDTGEFQTWHQTTGGIFDTLTGSMQRIGRLARKYEGKDARDYPDGTSFLDIR